MFYYLILIALAALILWKVVDAEWVHRQTSKIQTEELKGKATKVAGDSTAWVKKQGSQISKRLDMGEALKSWAMNEDLATLAGFTEQQSAALMSVRAWLAEKDHAQLKALAEEIKKFCKQQDIDLAWLLLDGGDVEMSRSFSGQVFYYILAVQERETSLSSARLRAWQAAPRKPNNAKFGDQLYIRCVDSGLVTVPAELLLASKKVRQDHQIQTVNDLIGSDREKVLAIVAELIAPAPAKQREPFWAKFKKQPVAEVVVEA